MKSLLNLPLIAFCILLPSQFLLAQETTDYTTSAGGSPIAGVIGLLIALLMIAAMWKVFTKAGQPGRASIIPIYTSTFGADRRPAGLVDHFDVDPVRQHHRRNCSLYRHGKKLRQRHRFRNRPRFPGNHFPAYPWFRQRAISRRCGCGA